MFKKALLVLSLLSFPLQAAVYKWIDEEGNTHFSDTPPQTEDEYQQIEVKINSYESAVVEENSITPNTHSNKVIMYSTSWCIYCKKARSYFEANNIDYEEFDIETSTTARREYDKIGGQGVPVILVGNKKINGFSADKFESVYSSL